MGLMDAFSEACGDFPAFRAAVVRARELATDHGTRQQLDHLIQSMDTTFAEVQQAVPKAVESMQQKLTMTLEQARKVQADAAVMKETIARNEAAEAAAAANKPAPVATPTPAVEVPATFPVLPAMAPLDLQAGLRLRDELLKRFGASSPVNTRDFTDEGSVAARWSDVDEPQGKEPAKPAVVDEWPAELRTPSSKKRSEKTPPAKPASDDDSIREVWDGDES